MSNSSLFINGVIDVSVSHGMFHFTIGEWVNPGSDKAEFIIAQRCAIPTGDARGLFQFLLNQFPADAVVGEIIEENSPNPKASIEPEASDNRVQKRRIARSIPAMD